jgi:hypothetical protein
MKQIFSGPMSSKVKAIKETTERIRNAKEIACKSPFKIEVGFERGRNLSDMERHCMDKSELENVSSDDMLYMLVTTSKDKYQCFARRGAFNALFRAIKELGVEIEF